MNSNPITQDSNEQLLRRAALVAGLVIFIPTAPYAEFYVFQKLIVWGNVPETVQNIMTNEILYLSGVYSYLITFIYDILLAWALYVFLNPVNKMVSLLTAWFRIVYAVIAIITLFNLVDVWRLSTTDVNLKIYETNQLYALVTQSIDAYRDGFMMAYVIFSIYLGLLGYLVYISGYIPKIFGTLLIIAGLGYLINSLRPFLFPGYNLNFLMITYLGELAFTLWLLIKGTRIKLLA